MVSARRKRRSQGLKPAWVRGGIAGTEVPAYLRSKSKSKGKGKSKSNEQEQLQGSFPFATLEGQDDGVKRAAA
jgi:hypothetical protein